MPWKLRVEPRWPLQKGREGKGREVRGEEGTGREGSANNNGQKDIMSNVANNATDVTCPPENSRKLNATHNNATHTGQHNTAPSHGSRHAVVAMRGIR